ncbi:nuclear transport factor 2 family protein [Natronosalvus halobius]|uniref:nuclear transport factor 2 family protein n=1 Tax=Natronosalvus halobius TaxID=2953746 RepID=UPI00209F215B|nr:nuclear transport factor 2 family protein [Natronosalvus halobius]USZ73667.1 nuclear transport factor 2 family protein [Natronosalvus halobius]
MESSTAWDELQNWHRICQLKFRYCYSIDDKRCNDFVDLFTDDAIIDYATRETYRGRTEIQGFIETHVTEFEQTTHTVLNPVIEIDGDSATGKWYGIVFLQSDGTTRFGQVRYDETYRRGDDGWKFASLKTESRLYTEI